MQADVIQRYASRLVKLWLGMFAAIVGVPSMFVQGSTRIGKGSRVEVVRGRSRDIVLKGYCWSKSNWIGH